MIGAVADAFIQAPAEFRHRFPASLRPTRLPHEVFEIFHIGQNRDTARIPDLPSFGIYPERPKFHHSLFENPLMFREQLRHAVMPVVGYSDHRESAYYVLMLTIRSMIP